MKYLIAALFSIFFAFPAFAGSAAEEACEKSVGPKSSSLEYVTSSAKAADIDVVTFTGLDLELFDAAYMSKYNADTSGKPEDATTLIFRDPRTTDKESVPAIIFNKDNCSIGMFPMGTEAVKELLTAVEEAKKGL